MTQLRDREAFGPGDFLDREMTVEVLLQVFENGRHPANDAFVVR
jgi:hypothetical protein